MNGDIHYSNNGDEGYDPGLGSDAITACKRLAQIQNAPPKLNTTNNS